MSVLGEPSRLRKLKATLLAGGASILSAVAVWPRSPLP